MLQICTKMQLIYLFNAFTMRTTRKTQTTQTTWTTSDQVNEGILLSSVCTPVNESMQIMLPPFNRAVNIVIICIFPIFPALLLFIQSSWKLSAAWQNLLPKILIRKSHNTKNPTSTNCYSTDDKITKLFVDFGPNVTSRQPNSSPHFCYVAK